jgi:2-polyprenyl-6-methoxyphenol hydroxylase-like FAD-dependent oxidoreductase
MDLAWRGIDVTIVERRRPGEPPEPKCNHVSSRSMEIYRRLGIAARLRNAGLPEDYPNDVSYRTSFTGTEFARIHIPAGAIASPTRTVRMAIGPRQNPRIVPIRSSLNLYYLSMWPPCRPPCRE